MKQKEKKMVMLDDPYIVEYRKDIEGWVSRDGHYFGKTEYAEQQARRRVATHKKCECGKVIEVGYLRCNSCQHTKSVEVYNEYEPVEYDGGFVYDDNIDQYFSELDELLCHYEDNDMNLSDARPLLCSNDYNFPEVNLDEWFDEYGTEDESFSDFHPDIAKKVDELNDILSKTKSKLWFSTKKRIDIPKYI